MTRHTLHAREVQAGDVLLMPSGHRQYVEAVVTGPSMVWVRLLDRYTVAFGPSDRVTVDRAMERACA